MAHTRRCNACGRAARAAGLVVAALAFAGCSSSYPKATPSYEFLTGYDRMTDRYDPLVSLVHMPDLGAFERCRGVVVGDIGVGSIWIEDEDEALGCATIFRCMLLMELGKLQKFDFVLLDEPQEASPPAPGEVCRIEGLITRFHLGSGWLRYFGGLLFFQTGATDLQIEGRVTDAASGKVIMEFVDRRCHVGNTPWGANPRNLSDRGFAMSVTAKQTAASLARFVETVGSAPASAEAER